MPINLHLDLSNGTWMIFLIWSCANHVCALALVSLPTATYLQQAPDARQQATTSGASAPSAKSTPSDQAATPTSRPGALHGEANSPVRVPANRVPYSNHPYVHRLVLCLLQIHGLSL